ncbi:hypothetical protein [Candidatus Venteria ishoeyi]|uniref:Addiction module component n=1 Tax=Candidatus Venteria ishoeyi TaxID=1899563 RepID=A0A1H6F6R0_9GAMM|nr:hypothetical protein [Candidatus Venteria ishoeyi]MDM8547744.1 hypothetical protein [Candidatus Venteria ishoeyi]SEH05830.1 Uncharacterised protein [Candidatus Venteria ishoeyi]
MNAQAIESLFHQAEQLPVDERLLLIERLVESVRRIHAETMPQAIPKASQQNTSKWARLARRVKENPIALGDYTVQLKRDMQEFKDNFAFKHDES